MIDTPTDTVPPGPSRSLASVALPVTAIGLCVLVEGTILASRNGFIRFIEEFLQDLSEQ